MELEYVLSLLFLLVILVIVPLAADLERCSMIHESAQVGDFMTFGCDVQVKKFSVGLPFYGIADCVR